MKLGKDILNNSSKPTKLEDPELGPNSLEPSYHKAQAVDTTFYFLAAFLCSRILQHN